MKIGAIIQARYNSSRFYGKVLKNLPFSSEETILSTIVKQIRNLSIVDEVIVATSEVEDDDIIEKYCKELGFICIRGSKENVLERFVNVIDERELDVVVRLTGDNPIILNDYLANGIEIHINNEYDYTFSSDLPYGTNFEIVNANILKDLLLNKNISKEDREHVTLYLRNNKIVFKQKELFYSISNLNNFRFTIDYPSDYAMMNIIFQFLQKINYEYDLNILNQFIDENEWITEINKNNIQKKQFIDLKDELKFSIDVLESLEQDKAVQFLKDNYKNL